MPFSLLPVFTGSELLKEKKAPLGAYFLRVDLILEGLCCPGKYTGSQKYLYLKKMVENMDYTL